MSAATPRKKTQKKTQKQGSLALVDYGIEKVTPQMAQEWLLKNEENRNVRPKLVAAYRRDMEEGRWEFTGETLQFSRTDRLLNGQHRLTALAESTDPICTVCGAKGHIEFMVLTGLPDESQTMMDQGKPRNIRDALLLSQGHVKNVTLVAAVARMLVLVPEVGPQMTPNLMRSKVTTAESLEIHQRYPKEITLSCERGQYIRQYLPGSPSGICYSYFQFFRVDPEACAEFFAGITDMSWEWPNDPRRAALRRMTYMYRDQEIKTSIETSVMLISVLTRAWNAWRKQEEMESIMVKNRSGIILPVRPI